MDLNSFIRRRLSSLPLSGPTTTLTPSPSSSSSSSSYKRLGSAAMRPTTVLAACSVTVSLLIVCLISLTIRNPPSDRLLGFADARVLDNLRPNSSGTTPPPLLRQPASFGEGSKFHNEGDEEKLLGGLLAPGFDEAACMSRYSAHLYRKASPFKPSSYLVSRLRNYEDLHSRCGPGSESYNVALEQIKSGKRVIPRNSEGCEYVVWISFSGLGNRILSLSSTFLYALLTNRVLLVDGGTDMEDLFCEPFLQRSWLLPADFPLIDRFGQFGQNTSSSYGNLVKSNALKTEDELIPPYLYLHLAHDYGDHDKLFFCGEDQALLAKVPWLIVKTDNYIVPSLFLIDSFEQELSKLFPEKGTVFHHLGRYLFHPSNPVWGLITRYYHAHMANADERIGVQIRVFDSRTGPLNHVWDQILACTLKEKLLPEVNTQESVVVPPKNPKLKSILVTNLYLGYSDLLSNMYWESPTTTGDIVWVHQPSHEEVQQTEKRGHNRKAWAEMYLLGLNDVLVTSSWSTFGYVAQGLGGLRPWILYKPENDMAPDPPCGRAMSIEPCFHAPPFYDCKKKVGIDTGKIVPHVRHCEDMSWGLKIVDGHHEL